MAVRTSNMGLMKWDSSTDYFSHAQLAANWQAVDDHDHTTGKGLKIPAGGLDSLSVATANLQDDSVTAAKLAALLITTAKLDNLAVTTGKLADLAVTDAKLASPNNSVYKTIRAGGGAINGVAASATPQFLTSTGTFAAHGSATTASSPVIYDHVSGDHLVASLTTKFGVKMEVVTGATSPSTVTFTAGLYPLTIASGNYSLGTVVTGSTIVSSGLAVNTAKRFQSSDFSASALLTDPGLYVLGVVVGSITVPAGMSLNLQLGTRNT